MRNEPRWVQEAKKGGLSLNGNWYQPSDYVLKEAPAKVEQPKRKIGFQYPEKAAA